MPELAEVEIVRASLNECLTGERIANVEVIDDELLQITPKTARELVGERIERVSRRAKYLLIELDSGQVILLHLRMTGSLLLHECSAPPERHRRFTVSLENGPSVSLVDPRRFGTVQVIDKAAADTLLDSKLGPEITERAFPAHLTRMLAGRHAPVRSLLGDQRIAAGAGAWLAEEALHAAGIHGLRPAGELSVAQVRLLARALRDKAREGMRRGGLSMRDYVHPDGGRGSMQEHLHVYQRAGEGCRTCGATIEHACEGAHRTYVCPRCQPRDIAV